jgi:hypothetical protein
MDDVKRPPLPVFGQPFITGSHAYGTPNEDSDIDLVMPASDSLCGFLHLACEGNSDRPCLSMRFGKLNLIWCVTPEQYQAWYDGTQYLISKAPVSRDRAKEVFAELRMTYGFSSEGGSHA